MTRKVVLTVTVTVTVNKNPGNAFCQKLQSMLILGQVSDSGSSLSSYACASALTVSDEESGTDSDSDSE